MLSSVKIGILKTFTEDCGGIELMNITVPGIEDAWKMSVFFSFASLLGLQR